MKVFAVLALVLLPTVASYYCCLYRNAAQTNPYLYAIAATSMQCNSDIRGWGNVIKQPWFVVNPEYCGKMANIGLPDVEIAPKKLTAGDMQATLGDQLQSSVTSEGDPVPCCLYISSLYYYTQPVYTMAMNPQYKPECPSTDYSIPIIGMWYVSSMYNECFFVTFTNNTKT
eukprot:TRINITY_DN10340_c0_g1_i1.p1 TRINITY_DN10340_c0_g1~~TRINITY_DN10340_c0_g1_i1.p1  ORF type:complete len:171 (-),score=14.79 TRINITY_DN10340_c0_g1_i1:69-581(-)